MSQSVFCSVGSALAGAYKHEVKSVVQYKLQRIYTSFKLIPGRHSEEYYKYKLPGTVTVGLQLIPF